MAHFFAISSQRKNLPVVIQNINEFFLRFSQGQEQGQGQEVASEFDMAIEMVDS